MNIKTEKFEQWKKEIILLNSIRIPTSWWQRKTYKRPGTSPPFNHWTRGSKEQLLRWLKADNILIHKYIKTYLKIIRILCNRLKNNRIKQRSTVIKIRKRNKTYCYSATNLTKFPTQNHRLKTYKTMKRKWKPDSKRSSSKPTAKQKTPATLPKLMCDKKGGCAQKLLFKVFFPQQKSIYFLKTKHLFLT